MAEKTTESLKKAKKPAPKESKMSASEVVETILELARGGNNTTKIGQILKSEHGVLNVKEVAGKRIGQILADNNLAPKLPADLNSLIQNANVMRKHLATHRLDIETKYGLSLTESKIRKLANYYNREKVLPADWKYVAEERTA